MASRTAVRQLLSRQPAASTAQRCARLYSSHAPGATMNVPINYGTTPLLHHAPSSLSSSKELPANAPTKRLNLYQSINAALRTALSADERVLLFGEDVAFGGVFRCSVDLQTEFGSERVFNTPLTEQGIVGFGIGAAAEGLKPVAEIQFADYVFPAFDQLVNEAAKFRYREGATGGHIGGLVVRMPFARGLFSHVPGLRVIMARSPTQAKGILLNAILHSNDPVIFMEPKILYRAAVEHVPTESYTLPLDKADVVKKGADVTVISYGQPLYLCSQAIAAAEKDFKGASVELIDLRCIYPWDRQTVLDSVRKTGRAIVVHESMMNAGVGAEVAASIQEGAFLSLEAPVKRVTGWDIHTGLIYERFNMPDVTRIYDAIKETLHY
ncbi:hypothetical protein FQN49_006710 [Arthroderma sp. PD_2]|nr:hypothetical protein FQN49_006710 [Arthroderma sp. PD_2]